MTLALHLLLCWTPNLGGVTSCGFRAMERPQLLWICNPQRVRVSAQHNRPSPQIPAGQQGRYAQFIVI